MADKIFKIVSRELWNTAEAKGVFGGAEIDLADGYIHFSTSNQVAETAAKHFQGVENLLLVVVDATQFGEQLKWETSRGGALFPHLYGTLKTDDVDSVHEFPVGADGTHVMPDSVVV